MTWRDRLQPASFRGVPFRVDSADYEVGRRTQVHEYPLRDDVDGDDLGRAARRFSIRAYVIGPDYDQARDRLIDALETAGPGTLVHPYYGRRIVMLERPARVRITTREAGKATFDLQFVETQAVTQPSQTTDTQTAATDAADAAKTSVLDDFADRCDISSLPNDLVDEVQERITDALDFVSGITTEISAVINTPADLAQVIYDGVLDIADTLQDPLRAIKAYESLFSAGDDALSVPQTTETRQAQARAVDASYQLIQRAAVVEACRQSAGAEYVSADQPHTARAVLVAGLDKMQHATDADGDPIDDTVYTQLTELRRRTVTDLRERALQLPRIRTVTPRRTLPAIVLAYQLYGDAARNTEIAERNNVRHPGFVPGGKTLEVLSE